MSTEHTPPHVERAEAILARTDEMSWPEDAALDARVDAIMAALPPEEQGVIDLFLRFARPAAAMAAVSAVLTVGAALVSATGSETTASTTDSTAIVDTEQEALDSASEVLALAEESNTP